MKRCWRCKCEKDAAEFGRSVSRKDGLNPCCKPCVREASTESSRRNAESRLATCAKYRAANTEKCRKAQADWRERDVERARLVKQEWAQKNRAITRASKKAWRDKNAHYAALRKAHVRRATPCWADMAAIAAVYAEAAKLTKETGVQHDVDHVIPLRGELVSGLHVHWNLRPLPSAENRAKSNRLDESVMAVCALVMKARAAEPAEAAVT